MSQKVVTQNPCRLSYPHLFQPQASKDGGASRYGCTILIPKSDAATVQQINAAIQAEWAEAIQLNGAWKGAQPPQPTITLYDGDQPHPKSGEPWGEECKGCYVLRTSCTNQPDVVDEFGNKALDASKFYAGCYCYFSVAFAAYDTNGNKGIGAFLNCVMWAQDGEPLEARASAKDDFASILAARGNQIPGAPTPSVMMGAPVSPATMGTLPNPAMPATPTGFPAAAPVSPAMMGATQAPAMPTPMPTPMPAPMMPAQQPPTGFGGFPIQ